jgi:hypothetical protein
MVLADGQWGLFNLAIYLENEELDETIKVFSMGGNILS